MNIFKKPRSFDLLNTEQQTISTLKYQVNNLNMFFPTSVKSRFRRKKHPDGNQLLLMIDPGLERGLDNTQSF